ncbi:L-methionine gamma-lyase-like [Biomphalaria glabrata]|uniref:plant cystathionine gamma-synthase n=2 Tax=Biomphalaria glabrata TaxID=6526 RepID=A0A9W3AXR5_BIOGL|nr:L-methionine gamma-lyase-like [Biomphalaria glabrata]KAI8763055.1 cystathionine gamma-lyase [Biomphalaria glabrata]
MGDSERQSIRYVPAKSNYEEAVAGLSLEDVTPTTAVVSARLQRKGPVTDPLIMPIYHSSTYVLEKAEDCLTATAEGAPIYSRLSNPTTEAAEAIINSLERGAGSITFSSGMAAVTSVMLGFLRSGDHVIYQLPVYPGTATALKHMKSAFGVELTSLKDVTVEKVEQLIKPNTKLLWFETPCNPDATVVDVERLAALAKAKNILIAVDGTFGSPALQHFIPYGIDFSVHSCTKYIGGHSDLIGGVVTTKTVQQWRVLKHIQGTYGNMLSPHDASLVIRGLKTLILRMEKISANALRVATFLEQHPKVQRVHYPGLKSHPQHEIAKKQMSAYSGMIMAEIKGGEQGGRTVAENVRVIRLAVSLGGVESLVEHPYSMTHGKYLLTSEETDESGITPGMLRISIGIEDAGDLIKDFDQALEKVVL